MKVKFIGDDTDRVTRKMGIKRNAVFMNAKLERGNFFERSIGREIILSIWILGNQETIRYQDMNTFDRNWEIL